MEPRRREAQGGGDARQEQSRTSRSPTGSRRTTKSSPPGYDRLFVPRNDPRFLRRNALVALGNAGGDASLAEPFAEGDDPLLREHAEWALERLR